jgi:thiamine biosynthesis lipoprotein
MMGMPIVVEVGDGGAWEAAVDEVFRWFGFVDETFSLYQPGSEISRLNRGEVELDDCHPAVRSVLRRCERLRAETGGYFDAHAAGAAFAAAGRLPAGAIDPSGLVKGWAVEGASRILGRAGARNYSVNAGGDIRLRGGPRPGESWRIGIQHPHQRDRVAAVLVADDLGIATSGEYERGGHIIDPHTGCRPEEVLSVTIVGPDLALADAYATAAFAMGAGGPQWTARLAGYGGMTIMADETVLFTPAFLEWRES